MASSVKITDKTNFFCATSGTDLNDGMDRRSRSSSIGTREWVVCVCLCACVDSRLSNSVNLGEIQKHVEGYMDEWREVRKRGKALISQQRDQHFGKKRRQSKQSTNPHPSPSPTTHRVRVKEGLYFETSITNSSFLQSDLKKHILFVGKNYVKLPFEILFNFTIIFVEHCDFSWPQRT